MKTLIKRLNLGVLLTGLVILTSCSSDVTFVSEAGMNAIYRTIPSIAITATKYSGTKISKYLMNSAEKNGKVNATKKTVKPNQTRKAMPITQGTAGGARLVSTPGQ